VRVVCGKGNNGGDGLVAARHLAETGFDVEALLLAPSAELSSDAAANLDRFPAAREIDPSALDDALADSGAIVDAIFGTGFKGTPRSPIDAAIEAINRCGAPVVACDIASGVNASNGEVEGVAVEADVSVSFHAAKVGHVVAPGKSHTGELQVAPIGIPDGAPSAPAAGLISPAVLNLIPRRGPTSTKFTSGQVVIVGGSRGLTGAVCMSARAATRAGAGYATVAVPADLESIFEVKLTEVMSKGLPEHRRRSRPGFRGDGAGGLRARRGGGAGPRPRSPGGIARGGASAGASHRGAPGARRRRPQRPRRSAAVPPGPQRPRGPHPARRRAGPPA